MEKPHIIVIPSWYAPADGIASGVYFKEQVLGLKKSGFTVGVIAPIFYDFMAFVRSLIKCKWPKHPLFRSTFSIENDVPVSRWHCLNVLTFRLPLLRNLNLFLYKKQLMRLMEQYIKAYGMPDLIHAHCVYWGGYVAMHISKKYNVPFIITEHASFNYDKRTILSWRLPYLHAVVESASKFLSVSHFLGKNIRNTCDVNYEVVPNIVDTNYYLLQSKKSHSIIKRFVTIAELKPPKGIHLLIEAFSQAFKGQDDIILEIGGSGREENQLKNLAKQLGIEHQIKFLGMLSRSQVRDLLYRADAFVLPSLYETFGVVFIEAMATGLPVIGTRSGGPEEIIINDELGLLVEPGKVRELKEALIIMLKNITSGCYNSEIIRDYTVKNYSQDIVLKKLNAIYNEVLSEKTP